MNIEIGKRYENKTWRFLLPSLRGHGDVFVNKFNLVYKLAVGIHDSYLDGSEISNGRNIYILVDKMIRPKAYNNFVDFIKYQKYYVADYNFEPEVVGSRKQMFILRIPERFYSAYDNFLKGKYSKMYTFKELNTLYASILHRTPVTNAQKSKLLDYEVLSRTGDNALKIFVKKIEREFNVKPDVNHYKNPKYEWEFPLKKGEEIFNHPNGKGVYFIEELDKVWQ